jgi:flagellin
MASILTNTGALNAANYLNLANSNLNESINELASGSRLADPSTDAAGVAVVANLTAPIGRLGAASQAVQNVVSYAQTVDGFLSTIQQQVTRLSELAESATNGSFGSADLANYSTEFGVILSQIDTVASDASFDGSTLFTAGTVSVAIDASGDTDTFVTNSIGSTSSLGINTATLSSITAAGTAIGLLNTAIASLSTRRATVNADISKFNFYVQNIQTETTNLTSAKGTINDVDVAQESTVLSQNSILLQSATSVLAQANTAQDAVLKLLQ